MFPWLFLNFRDKWDGSRIKNIPAKRDIENWGSPLPRPT